MKFDTFMNNIFRDAAFYDDDFWIFALIRFNKLSLMHDAVHLN